MPRRATARSGHLLVAGIAAVAVVWQLVLVVDGAATLLPEQQPALVTRLVRFVSYFTILSNLLVLATSVALARDPDRDGRLWRVVRLDALVAITVTGLVHWFLLRPLLDLSGASHVVDKLLHVVVPLLAVGAWLLVGPRGRLTGSEVLPALVYPLGWLGWTLVHGAATGWYPYPFVDVDDLGYGVVALNSVGVAVLVLAVSLGVVTLDRWLAGRPSLVGRRAS